LLITTPDGSGFFPKFFRVFEGRTVEALINFRFASSSVRVQFSRGAAALILEQANKQDNEGET
jgi:hypothetical protein